MTIFALTFHFASWAGMSEQDTHFDTMFAELKL